MPQSLVHESKTCLLMGHLLLSHINLLYYLIINSFKHTNFLQYRFLTGQQDRNHLSLKVQHLTPGWRRSLSETPGTAHVMPRSVCDWDRWGSKWRERKGGECRARAAWEHCLEESLGRLFPVVCLIRYSGVLSHYKTCRRNLFWLFCAHRNKENHPGSE